MSRPEDIQLAAGFLQMGIADAEHVTGYLGGDAEAVQIAEALAEKRGAFPMAGASDALKARLAKLASHALCLGLATPDLLAAAFAAWPDGAEVAAIAEALARNQLAAEPGRRRPPCEPAPLPVVLQEVDPFTGAPGAPYRPVQRDPAQPVPDLTACSRGAHAYGPVESDSGWSRCLSCGYVLVVDRRPGPGGLLANADGFAPQPSLPPSPKGTPQWPY